MQQAREPAVLPEDYEEETQTGRFDGVCSIPRRPCFTNVAAIPDFVRAVRTDPGLLYVGRCEDTNVLPSLKLITIMLILLTGDSQPTHNISFGRQKQCRQAYIESNGAKIPAVPLEPAEASDEEKQRGVTILSILSFQPLEGREPAYNDDQRLHTRRWYSRDRTEKSGRSTHQGTRDREVGQKDY